MNDLTEFRLECGWTYRAGGPAEWIKHAFRMRSDLRWGWQDFRRGFMEAALREIAG